MLKCLVESWSLGCIPAGQIAFSRLISQWSLASAMCFFSPWANKMLHASLSTDPTNTNVQMDTQTHICAHRRQALRNLDTEIFVLYFCAISRRIRTHFHRELIIHKSCHNASLPTYYTFKSGPCTFIDSNLRIVLEFWHLLILNLLTPGGPELYITPGIYLNTYKENIPKAPWIVAIHAYRRDSKCA